MAEKRKNSYVGRGGEKLKFAIDRLNIAVEGRNAADFGCNIGGFTDCLLREGARLVYAVDTGYGMLEWKLRCDSRVVVMERTNAMHLALPEEVDIVTIDVGWTRQKHILPAALKSVKEGGEIISLFKPQYEAEPSEVKRGLVAAEDFDAVLRRTLRDLRGAGIIVAQTVRLPRVRKRKNLEAMLYLRRGQQRRPCDCGR